MAKNDYVHKDNLGEYKAAKAAKAAEINPRRMDVKGSEATTSSEATRTKKGKKESAPIADYRGVKLVRSSESRIN